MIALQGMMAKTRPLIERVDALTLRERVIIFGAGVALGLHRLADAPHGSRWPHAPNRRSSISPMSANEPR